MDNGSAVSASSTRPPSCSLPSSPDRPRWPVWWPAPGWRGPPRTGWPSPSSTIVSWPATCRAGSSSGRGSPSWPAAAGEDRLLAAAGPILARLRDITGESAQLCRRQGDHRVCVAAAERPAGLRDTVPVGSQLPMRAGSAAQVLLAWEDPERMHRGLQNAAFSATALSGIRRRGWAQSVGEREQGVASVSAPVRSPGGKILAAVSVSGPLERLSRQPGRMHAPAVLAAAERLSESLRRAAAE